LQAERDEIKRINRLELENIKRVNKRYKRKLLRLARIKAGMKNRYMIPDVIQGSESLYCDTDFSKKCSIEN